MSLVGPGRFDIVEQLAALGDTDSWPTQDLWITAVRREDGRHVVFGRDRDAPLHLAVASSCAVPGYSPADRRQRVRRRRAHSPTSADLLRTGTDLVVVVSHTGHTASDRPVRRVTLALARLPPEVGGLLSRHTGRGVRQEERSRRPWQRLLAAALSTRSSRRRSWPPRARRVINLPEISAVGRSRQRPARADGRACAWISLDVLLVEVSWASRRSITPMPQPTIRKIGQKNPSGLVRQIDENAFTSV
jgi:predicted acylesterase/phospholipase RssA